MKSIYWLAVICVLGYVRYVDSNLNVNKTTNIEDLEVKAKGVINSLFAKLLPTILRNSNGKLSLDCNIGLIRVATGVRNLDGWALRVLDSSGKLPGGILKGTLTAFGSYDECVDINIPSKNPRHIEPHFQGKYCSVQFHAKDGLFQRNDSQSTKSTDVKTESLIFQMKKYGNFMSQAYLRFGICVPASCNETDLLELSQSMLEKNDLPVKIKIRRCEVKSHLTLSPSHISVLCIIAVLIAIVIFGTIFDCLLNTKRAFGVQLLTSFSMTKNFQELFEVDGNGTEITCLNGIRFLTSLWIILGHTYLLPLGVHYTRFRNVSAFVRFQKSFSYSAIGNFYLSVDTFFFISISPVYYFIIGVFVLLPLLGSGPMWYDAVESQADICKSYWWANLLYIQNFWPIKEHCMLHSWYLAATVQIHVISFFILWPLIKNARLGLVTNTVVLFGSTALTGFVTYWYDLKPTMDVLGGHNSLAGVASLIYVRPYSHLPAFSIGIFLGYLLAFEDKIVLSKVTVFIGSLVALAVNMLVIYGLHEYYKGNHISHTETILYSALHRPAWAVSVAWFVFLCASGNGGILNTVLSWSVFSPLAKLSFVAYLVHPLIILYQLGSSRERQYLSHFEMVMHCVSVSCVSYALAVLLHVGLEVPCLKIERLFKIIVSSKSVKKSFSTNHSSLKLSI